MFDFDSKVTIINKLLMYQKEKEIITWMMVTQLLTSLSMNLKHITNLLSSRNSD